ncbi:transposase [Melghirimyces profundicolus]|uniref:transposase n=1 Tax=Melghirimyces profundicolus TaxID=1242148 RepID=UPI000D3B2AF6
MSRVDRKHRSLSTGSRKRHYPSIRRAAAQIPADVSFQNKPEMALDLLDWARKEEVPFKTVTADAGYGGTPGFLEGLEARDLPYVVAVPSNFGVRSKSFIRPTRGGRKPARPTYWRRPKRFWIGCRRNVGRRSLRGKDPGVYRPGLLRSGCTGPMGTPLAR